MSTYWLELAFAVLVWQIVIGLGAGLAAAIYTLFAGLRK